MYRRVFRAQIKRVKPSFHFQEGAAMVEVAICAPLLMMLGLGIVQIGLIYHAKTNLNYATFEAARRGAVNNAQSPPMLDELGVRLGPVFGGTGTAKSALRAISLASFDILDSRYTRLQILSPSSEAFSDWGVLNPISGKTEIPNSHLRQRYKDRVVKNLSGVTLQDANLLRIKVTYGYKMSVPLVGRWFAAIMLGFNPASSIYYKSRRIPLTSVATVRMQSAAWEDENVNSVAGTSEGNGTSASNTSDSIPVTVSAPTSAVGCDSHGLSNEVDAEMLDNLMLVGASSDQCAANPVTIEQLLETGTGEGADITDCESSG